MRTHYLNELQEVRKDIVAMGETTLALFTEAIRAVVDPKPDVAEKASELEARTDHQHRMIHDQCLDLITLQAPVASDARLITGILDAIVDLELIGDYAYEIVTLTEEIDRKPPSQILAQFGEAGGKIREILVEAIDRWRNLDCSTTPSVRPREAPIRAECESIYSKLAQLVSTPGEGTAYVDLMLICKHLSRILRHALSVADQAADAAPLHQAP